MRRWIVRQHGRELHVRVPPGPPTLAEQQLSRLKLVFFFSNSFSNHWEQHTKSNIILPDCL